MGRVDFSDYEEWTFSDDEVQSTVISGNATKNFSRGRRDMF